MSIAQQLITKPQCEVISPSAIPIKNLHQEIEFVYVLSGILELSVNETELSLEKGSLIGIGPNIIHQLYPERNPSRQAKLKYLPKWFLTPFLESNLFDSQEKKMLVDLYNHAFVVRHDAEISNTFIQMLNHATDPFYQLTLLAGVSAITKRLLNKPELIIKHIYCTQQNKSLLGTAISFINENYANHLTLKMLADHLGFSESYCSRYLRRMFGTSFTDYVNIVRINNAQRFLAYTNDSITEISDKTGFSSSQCFCRTFKAKTGLTPTRFRTSRKLSF